MKRACLFLLLAAAMAWAAERPAQNVILFIGDAAGLGVIKAAAIHAGKPQLFIQQMPHIGLMETSSASEWVTDSAAAATAIATGRKTHNGVVSQSDTARRGSKDGEPLKTLLEHAEERGLATGLVTNDEATGATVAAFYSHSNDRKKKAEIFAQVLKPRFGDGVDVLIGAGRSAILQAAAPSGDIRASLREKDYLYCESLDQIRPGARRVVALLDSEDYDLAPAVESAVRILSGNRKGFFLLVESNLHTKDLAVGLERTVVFDRIIEQTSARLKGDTLVLFAADHSFDTRLVAGKKGEPLVQAPWATGSPRVLVGDGHSGEEVLVAAQGPGSERVRGFFPNTRLFEIIMAAYGWQAQP